MNETAQEHGLHVIASKAKQSRGNPRERARRKVASSGFVALRNDGKFAPRNSIFRMAGARYTLYRALDF